MNVLLPPNIAHRTPALPKRAVQPVMEAYNASGAMVSQTVTVPIHLDELHEHVEWFKRVVERDAPACGKIVRIVVDLAL